MYPTEILTFKYLHLFPCAKWRAWFKSILISDWDFERDARFLSTKAWWMRVYNKWPGNGFILLETHEEYVGLRAGRIKRRKTWKCSSKLAQCERAHAVQAFYNGHSINGRTIIFDRTLFAPEHDLLHVANSRFADWATFLPNKNSTIFFFFFFRKCLWRL